MSGNLGAVLAAFFCAAAPAAIDAGGCDQDNAGPFSREPSF